MKKMIESKDLVFEYIRRDEEGNVDGIIRAVDGVTGHSAGRFCGHFRAQRFR